MNFFNHSDFLSNVVKNRECAIWLLRVTLAHSDAEKQASSSSLEHMFCARPNKLEGSPIHFAGIGEPSNDHDRALQVVRPPLPLGAVSDGREAFTLVTLEQELATRTAYPDWYIPSPYALAEAELRRRILAAMCEPSSTTGEAALLVVQIAALIVLALSPAPPQPAHTRPPLEPPTPRSPPACPLCPCLPTPGRVWPEGRPQNRCCST